MVLSFLGMRPSRGKKHTRTFSIFFACYSIFFMLIPLCEFHSYILAYHFIANISLFILTISLIYMKYKNMHVFEIIILL